MKGEKRKPRAYKITDKYYSRAQRKAAKSDKSLAERIEDFVIEYGKPAPRSKCIPLPADFLSFSEIGVLKSDGTVEPLYNKHMTPFLGDAINGTRKNKRK
jgi:hypothetical protein